MRATIYLRRNGEFGASCGGVQDTGHHILEDSGRFTVYSINDEDVAIAERATQDEAERAIADDWRAQK